LTNLFISPDLIAEDTVTITGSQHHHLARVLRLKAGDSLNVLDNQGHLYKTAILEIAKTQTICKILESLRQDTSPLPKVILTQALIKGEKMDWVVQKATELGVSEIVPLITKNTIVKLDPKDIAKKIERWQAIAQGAAEQCERWDAPAVREPVRVEALTVSEGENGFYGAVVRDSLGLLNLNAGPLNPPKGGLKCGDTSYMRPVSLREREIYSDSSLILVIGPEGGLTLEEETLLSEKGFAPVSFSANVLRAETAAIVGVSWLMRN